MVWNCIRSFLYVFILCAIPITRTLSSTDSIYKMFFLTGTADKWSSNILKEKVSLNGLDQAEPGFDLTNEEIKKFKLWPDGIIPYFIDDFSYDKVLRDRIRHFLESVGALTGLHFREIPGPPSDKSTRWVFFVNRQAQLGCSDHTPLKFTNEGVQKVVLGYNCMREEGELAEAVLAIVGVPPQHNSPDRDSFIKVQTENIIPEKQYLFKKLQNNEWLFHDLKYDFNSAGHFHFHKHTKNGLATISPKKSNEMSVGENEGFSYTDILKIRMLYNYISRKKSKTIKAPECKKIFKPGRNFSQFQPDPEKEIIPRPKPRKYTGKSATLKGESGNAEEEGDIAPNREDTQKYPDIKEENNNKDIEDENTENAEDESKKSSRDNFEREVEDVKKKSSRNPAVQTLKADPLLLLSDYNTDDESNREKGGKLIKKNIR